MVYEEVVAEETKKLLFRPVSEGYCDGEGGYSAIGWVLSNLGVGDSILLQLTTDRPFNELATKHGVDFFEAHPGVFPIAVPPAHIRELADALCADIEKYNDTGKHDLCMILIGYLLRNFEPWLSKYREEEEYIVLRLSVIEYNENSIGHKIFPRPLGKR